MSEEMKKKSCSGCKAYLFEEDDVVCCPICGAPHHRECWNALGDCALNEYHGTENQYKNVVGEEPQPTSDFEDEYTTCAFCKERYPKDEKICPKCSMPSQTKAGVKFISFDFLGGVPADLDLGKGVTADEAKRFVFTNTQRYIPRFAKFASGFKSSWNWLAFLFPGVWMLSRKMYKSGIIVTAASVICTLLTIPMAMELESMSPQNTTDFLRFMYETLPNMDTVALMLSYIGATAYTALRILIGIFGDNLYYRHTINTVSRIKQSSDDASVEYEKHGGVNLMAALIGYLAVSYLPQLLLIFT